MAVSVLWPFLVVPSVGMQCVIVAFPGHTNSFLICLGVGKSIDLLYARKEWMLMLA